MTLLKHTVILSLSYLLAFPVGTGTAFAQDAPKIETKKAQKIKTDADEDLVEAVENGDLAAVRAALADGANPSGARKDRFSALALAAEKGQTEITKTLLDAGADPNLKSKSRQTAAQLAATHGHLDIIKMLTEAGADINYRGYKRKFVFSLLTPLMLAANSGHPEIVAYLLERGADPNRKVRAGGSTALHFAALNGRADIMALLINHGADVNQPDLYGLTPIFSAIVSEKWQAVAMTLAAGADVHQRIPRNFRVGADDQHMRPIMLAANRLADDVVLLLLLQGADPHERSYLGETALMAAEATFTHNPYEKNKYDTIRRALEDPEWGKQQAAQLYGQRLAEARRNERAQEVSLLTALGIKPLKNTATDG